LSESEKYHNAALELENQNKLTEAIAKYDEAIRLNLYFVLAYNKHCIVGF